MEEDRVGWTRDWDVYVVEPKYVLGRAGDFNAMSVAMSSDVGYKMLSAVRRGQVRAEQVWED